MMHTPRALLALAVFPLAVATTACEDDDSPSMVQEPGTIVEVAQAAGSFSTLLTALDVASLKGALEGSGPFTVFAPTDEAFAALDPEVLNDLLADTERLAAVLTYHVVPGLFRAKDVVGLSSAATLNGKLLRIGAVDGAVKVDDATVLATDIEASNGVIHVIDSVILPEPVADIVQVARGAGIFNTLLAAVDAAGLTEVLKGDGPFTVFAPTDEAFAAVPAEALNALIQDPAALTSVLTYHVVPGSLSANQVLARTHLPTVNGTTASVSIGTDGKVRIDDAVIAITDVPARNGVIHVIDRVIFPR